MGVAQSKWLMGRYVRYGLDPDVEDVSLCIGKQARRVWVSSCGFIPCQGKKDRLVMQKVVQRLRCRLSRIRSLVVLVASSLSAI